MVERNLNVYMNYLDSKLYYFRDSITGLEADSILEFKNKYKAIEIKLVYHEVESAIEKL